MPAHIICTLDRTRTAATVTHDVIHVITGWRSCFIPVDRAPLNADPEEPVFGSPVSIVQLVPEQSVRVDAPDAINVELICSIIDDASIVCVLSILFRLFEAMELMIRAIILSEPIMRSLPPSSFRSW